MTSENDNSLSKQEAVEQLRKTIAQLETIIQELNNTSAIDLPNSTAIENLLKTTTELVQIIPQEAILQQSDLTNNPEVDVAEKRETESARDRTLNVEQITTEPQLRKIENETVESIKKSAKDIKETSIVTNQKTPNNRRIIIGVVAAIIITIIPISWKLFLSDRTPQLISRNNITDQTTNINPAADNITITEAPSAETQPSLNNSPTDEITTNQTENIAEPETEVTSKIPSELVAENRPQKISIDTIKPTIKLTPEQNLIAALEAKTNNVAARYNEDLVISIAPNFTDSIVMVTLADDWYQLVSNRQDKIMEEMLKQSRQLEFQKLKITDSNNNLIARSPIVGKDMVILRRTI